MVVNFWETSILFSLVSASVYIHINQCMRFAFSLHTHQQLVFCCLFDNNHSDRCKVVSLWFWFDYPCWLVMLNIYSCVCGPSVCLPWKNVYSGPLLNFNWIICFFNIELFEFLKRIVWILILCWLYHLQYLSHSVGGLFILLMVSFTVQKPSSLM